VEELARCTIAWAKAKRAAEIEPFEAQITAETMRRVKSKRRWFRQSTERQDVIRDLCWDWCWSLSYMFAQEAFSKSEQVSRRLLLATKESADGFVWVSVADRAVIS
jgi:hypothetical protein